MIFDVDLISLLTPYLIVIIVAENYLIYKQNKRINVNDTLSSFSSGGLSIVLDWLILMQEKSIGGFFDSIFHPYQITNVGIKSLVAMLFLVDLSYYWAHYSSHHVSLLWATHSPHHSSEEYNLSTAFRQGMLETFTNFFFFLPWCVIFPFKNIIWFRKLNLLWQFFVHTECIDKFPSFIENFFNTPSHHRVHHARNKIYCDKNFGGMFIIWDKLFGTFEEEKEKPVFGLVHPIQTFEPISVQLYHLKTIYKQITTYPSLYLKVKALFSPPGFTYDPVTKKSYVMEIPEKIDTSIPKLDTKGNQYTGFFSIASFLIVFVTFFWVKENQNQFTTFNLLCWQFVVMSMLSNIFLVSENKKYNNFYFFVFLFSLFTVAFSDLLLVSKLLLTVLFTSHYLLERFVLCKF